MNALNLFLSNHRAGCLANQGLVCTCGLAEAQTELNKLQIDNTFMSAQIDEINIPQPRGHLQRWLVVREDTQYCCLCRLEEKETRCKSCGGELQVLTRCVSCQALDEKEKKS